MYLSQRIVSAEIIRNDGRNNLLDSHWISDKGSTLSHVVSQYYVVLRLVARIDQHGTTSCGYRLPGKPLNRPPAGPSGPRLHPKSSFFTYPALYLEKTRSLFWNIPKYDDHLLQSSILVIKIASIMRILTCVDALHLWFGNAFQ